MNGTNFDKVCEFMTIFGQKVNTTIDYHKLIKDSALHTFRFNLINEEFKETAIALGSKFNGNGSPVNSFIESIKESDIVEFADGVGDLLVVIYGTMAAFGINPRLSSCDTDSLDDNFKFVKNMNEFMKEKPIIVDDIKTNIVSNFNCIHSILEDMNLFIHQYKVIISSMDLDTRSENIINSYSIISIIKQLLHNTYLLGIYAGLDVNKIFDLVHTSNMSKLCPNEENAIDTINTVYKNHSIYKNVKYRKQSNYYIVYNELDEGNYKILKSKDFKEPLIKEYLGY
jgi:predicted HAD superfamily Cof-like phosphohydrolase